MALKKARHQWPHFTQALLHLVPLLITTSAAVTQADGFESCDYNGRAMRCKRTFNSGVMTLTWQDGMTDRYQLVHRTTNTTSKWRDSRGGQWNSLAYSGRLILINPNNSNTIIIGGTREQCMHNWKLGKVCGGN